MYQRLWKDSHSAICLISFYSDNGIKITSLTGFKVNSSIITDEYIYKIVKCEEVVFQFVREDGCTPGLAVKMPFTEFSQRVNRLVEFENEGYAIIALDGVGVSGIPSLTFEMEPSYCIGESIAIVGYHIDQGNLSIKNGIISSFFKANDGRRFIQFDAAVKQGNAGSPLLNVTSGKVIGVVGHRLASFTKSYDAFKKIIDENLRLLKKSEGKMNIMEIDPIQVLVANQNQLKQISKEFYKSAAMSFGYAHEIISVHNYTEAVLGSSELLTCSRTVNSGR